MFAVAVRAPQIFEQVAELVTAEHFGDGEEWLSLIWRIVHDHFKKEHRLPTTRFMVNRCNSGVSLNPELVTDAGAKKLNLFFKLVNSLLPDDLASTSLVMDCFQKFLEDRLVMRAQRAMALPATPLSLAEVFTEYAEKAASLTTLNKQPMFPIISAAELAAGDYRVNFIVEELLVANQFCVMAGPKKSLKTSLAVQLAICIARGVPFWTGSASTVDAVCWFARAKPA